MICFFDNAWFITGTLEFTGTLADAVPGRKEHGFLSFVRLIGTVCFKKHLVEFSHTIYSLCSVRLTNTAWPRPCTVAQSVY